MWGYIIAGILSALGSIYSSNKSAESAKKQMIFQDRMSSTAYQRGVLDMEAAGINPMMAYSQGGASSPAGASSQTSDPLSPAVSSAMQYQRMKKELELMDANIDAVTENAETSRTQQELNKEMLDKVEAEVLNIGQQTRNLGVQNAMQNANLPKLLEDQKIYQSKWGEVLRKLRTFSESVGLKADSFVR